jgi:hypothetical protein
VHINAHEGLLGDHANPKDLLVGEREFEESVLREVWGGPARVRPLPIGEQRTLGAFGWTGLTAACSAAGLGHEQTLEVLDATATEVRDEAAERRRT